MSLINTLRGLFRADAPKLRNKAGGMAWIKGIDNGNNGAEALNNRAVKTLRVTIAGNWEIDPPQRVKIHLTTHYQSQNVVVNAGDVITVTAIADECLQPWKEDGVTDAEVVNLYCTKPVKELV